MHTSLSTYDPSKTCTFAYGCTLTSGRPASNPRNETCSHIMSLFHRDKHSHPPRTPRVGELRRLRELQSLVASPFAIENEQHEEMLKKLWVLLSKAILPGDAASVPNIEEELLTSYERECEKWCMVSAKCTSSAVMK